MLTLLALCLLLYRTVDAAIWYVNVASTSTISAGTIANPCKNIVCAVALAQSGDSIYVYPGTYRAQDGNGQICVTNSCSATGVSLLGQGPPSSIEIVGNGTNARFMSIVGGTFVAISNITVELFAYTEVISLNDIVSGLSYPTGGSISVKASNVSFSNVVFRNNSAISGGALDISSGSVVDITGCIFQANSADIRGGAVASDLSTLTIRGSIFIGNGAYGYSSYIEVDGNGGALFFLGTNLNKLTMDNTEFYNNSAIRCGGGVYIDSFSEHQLSVDAFGLTFRSNFADGAGTCANSATCTTRGGAVYISALSAVIANSSFYDNGAYVGGNQLASGGAVYSVMNTNLGTFLSSNFSIRIVHSTFGGNYADSLGGAFYSSHQRLEMDFCTFADNIVGSESTYFDDHQTAGGAIWLSAESSSSYISHCAFTENIVYGGWGGAIFATDTYFLNMDDLTFNGNLAVSSYSYGGEGGALMLSGSSNVSITGSTFYNNSALPQPLLSPKMLSGSGGALSVQSAILLVKGCYFERNVALTGQFDSGSSGGAILLEHSSDATIYNCEFVNNGAAGYLGFSTYSSSGTGGAILSKFSSLIISVTKFTENWVTVGGTQLSSGAAVAIFSTYTGSSNPITISDTTFQSNTAFGDVCLTSGPKAGQGGAVSVVGATTPGVSFKNVIFSDNVAMSIKQTGIPSFGGAISLSLVSLVKATNCTFMRNIALNGLGNDITVLPMFGSSIGSNMTIKASTFVSATIAHNIKARVVTEALSEYLCSFVSLKSSATIPTNDRRLLMPSARKADSGLVFHDKALYEKVSAAPYSTLAQRYSELRSKYECEEEKEAAASLMSSGGSSSGSYRRQLSLFSKFDLILDPSIMIAAGSVYFRNPTFDQNYNIFVGNLLTLLGLEDVSGYSAPDCSAYLYGDIAQEQLVVIGYKASITLAMTNTKQIALKGLHLLNATLSVSNNVSVSGNSTLSSSNIMSLASVYSMKVLPFTIGRNISLIPSINFLGKVYTGLGFENSLGLVGLSDDSILDNLWPTREITFESCTVNIHSTFRISSPIFQPKSTTTSKFLLRLKSKAEMYILPGASLYITTGTTVQADSNSDLAISNSGFVYLTGFSVAVSSLIGTSKTFDINGLVLSDDSSVYSALNVEGGFAQTPTGSIHVTIGNIGANYTMMRIYSNESMLGSVNVNLAEGTDLSLYGEFASNWTLATYKKVKRNVGGRATINSPTGLGFGGVYRQNATTDSWREYLVIQNIGCSQLSGYYSQNSLCGYCNMNSSCSYCTSGICVDEGQCASYGSIEAENCCVKDCLHGECRGEVDSGFVCECNFFYSGSNCTELSAGALAIIIVSVFLFTLFSVTFYVQNYFIKGQKSLVLEELRQGLLQSEDGAYSSDNKVIQSLQQELILKDVFVNFKEIKLEGKIGEGSFGVVFKASFRGAQVAVKKMRSPIYMELTQHDIEEFRKEAYTMSRLRHPNIVLVMGISLVDRDPVKPHPDMDSPRIAQVAKKDSITSAGATSNKTVCIITEYLGQGSLADILYGPQRLPAEVWTYELILTCALQAARGMIYLHSHQPPICHRDLKSSNLVVDDHWVVKVTDFGMSRIVPEKLQDLDKGIGPIPVKVEDKVKVEEAIDYYFERDSLYNRAQGSDTSSARRSFTSASLNSSGLGANSALVEEALNSAGLEMTSNLGTTAWCAPELLTVSSTTKYSVKVDVYSFGMVLWELWEKKRPFDELHSRFDIMDAVRSGRRPAIGSNCPPAYAGLIQRCWATDPVRRPMFKYIVKYLKDELANVKRRGTTPGSSSLPPGLFSSSSLTEWNPMARFESSASPLTSTDAPTSTVGALMNWVGVRSRSNTMTSDTRGGAADSSSIDNIYPVKPTTQLSEQLIPEGRKSLVAFERSLSYLAQSPAVGTPGNSSYLTSVMQQSSGSASAAQSNQNTWRDKYVMKFSGWKATQPDVGLPPSKPLSAPRVDTFTLPPRVSTGITPTMSSANNDNSHNHDHRREVKVSNNQIMDDTSGIFAIDNVTSISPIDEQRSSMVYNAIHVASGQSSARNSNNSKRDADDQPEASRGTDIVL